MRHNNRCLWSPALPTAMSPPALWCKLMCWITSSRVSNGIALIALKRLMVSSLNTYPLCCCCCCCWLWKCWSNSAWERVPSVCSWDGGGGVEDEQRKQFTANGRFKSLLTRSISFLAVLVVLRIFSIWLTGIFLF